MFNIAAKNLLQTAIVSYSASFFDQAPARASKRLVEMLVEQFCEEIADPNLLCKKEKAAAAASLPSTPATALPQETESSSSAASPSPSDKLEIAMAEFLSVMVLASQRHTGLNAWASELLVRPLNDNDWVSTPSGFLLFKGDP